MRFFSDNAAPVHPAVMQAMADANHIDTAYDGDQWSARLDAAFSAVFGRDVAVLWVATGTSANCLALASLVQPHQGVICHREAHIEVDECGAPGFYTAGAKLMLVEGDGAKVTPETVEACLNGIRNDVHQVQAAALSITNATEYGMVYSPAEVAALGALCHDRGLSLHMDGARFANAIAHLGCAPADVTWRAGVDVLSFGFVKNGGMSTECLVYFDKAKAAGVVERRKRAGHLLSKGRYMAAQVIALLQDDVWLTNARAANEGPLMIMSTVPKVRPWLMSVSLPKVEAGKT